MSMYHYWKEEKKTGCPPSKITTRLFSIKISKKIVPK